MASLHSLSAKESLQCLPTIITTMVTSQSGRRRLPEFKTSPQTYFKPPYVGVKGWIGIELEHIGDEELSAHIAEAWRMIAPKKLALAKS